MSEGGDYTLRGVEIFCAGEHRGKAYARADLDDIARNFERFSSPRAARLLLRVPAVLGHEETQEFLARSDLPAAGWASRVWRDGDSLRADFDGVPAAVARLLRGRAYRTVSAEVYDRPPPGVPGEGKALRRVAFLGGDLPQIKTLEEIPVPEPMHERFAAPPPCLLKLTRTHALPGGAYACFSEVVPMDPEQILAALAAKGADAALLRGCPAPALAEVLRLLESAGQQPPPAEAPDQMFDRVAGYLEAHPEPDGDEAKAAAFAEGVRKFFERARPFFEKYGCRMAEAEPDGDEPDPAGVKAGTAGGDDDRGPDKMSEKRVAELVEKAVARAVEAARAQGKGDLAELQRFREETLAAERKRAVDAFCETRLAQGKILPCELDDTAPSSLKKRLLRADARAVVERFSEGGREVALTELDLQMREIDARPAFKFGEKVGAGKADAAGDEAAKVERFSESRDCLKALEAAGKTPAEYVEGFKKLQKARPGLTAAEYGVPAWA